LSFSQKLFIFADYKVHTSKLLTNKNTKTKNNRKNDERESITSGVLSIVSPNNIFGAGVFAGVIGTVALKGSGC
jgi:hypothetical protein